MSKNKVISKYGITIILFFAIIISIFILVKNSHIDKKIVFSRDMWELSEQTVACDNISQQFLAADDKLYCVEVTFDNIPSDENGWIDVNVQHNEKDIFLGKIPFNSLKNQMPYIIRLNIPTVRNELYRLNLASNTSKKIPQIYVSEVNKSSESESCTRNNEIISQELSIRYGYLSSTVDYKLSILLIIIVVYCILLYFFFAPQVWGRVHKYLSYKIIQIAYIIFQMFCCLMILNLSVINFKSYTKVLMIICSIVFSYNHLKKLEHLMNYIQFRGFRIAIILTNLYIAFALAGSQVFIYPIDLRVSLKDILLFLITLIWCFPVLTSLLYFYNRIKISFSLTQKRDKLQIIVISSLLLLIPVLIVLAAFNPGFSSYDTNECLAQYAHNIRNMPDWHPPFYIMILKIIITVWDSTYAVILVQIFFWIYVWEKLFQLLFTRGIHKRYIYMISLIMGLNAAYSVQLCTIWKDIFYAISILWLTVIIAELIFNTEKCIITIRQCIELTAALICVFFFRQNGVVPYVLTLVALFILLRKNKRVVLSLLLSICLVLIIKFPIYHALDVNETQNGGMYIGLSQDIMGVYCSGGDVSEETMEMINVLTRQNNNNFSFVPYWANESYDLNVPITKFIKNYLNTFIHNPLTMTRAIICRQDFLWNIFEGQDAITNCVNYLGTEDGNGEWNTYYPAHKEISISYAVKQYTLALTENQLSNVWIWRVGLHIVLLVLVSLTLFLKQKPKHFILLYIPIIGQIISLMLSTGWADFRYYWPVNLMAMSIMYIITILPKKKTDF